MTNREEFIEIARDYWFFLQAADALRELRKSCSALAQRKLDLLPDLNARRPERFRLMLYGRLVEILVESGMDWDKAREFVRENVDAFVDRDDLEKLLNNASEES